MLFINISYKHMFLKLQKEHKISYNKKYDVYFVKCDYNNEYGLKCK